MNKVLDYIAQSAEQLVLRVFDCHPPRGVLNILARQTLRKGNFQVEACIIGTSHAVLVTHGEHEMAEVFSCGDTGEGPPRLERGLETLNEPVHAPLEGLNYRFTSHCVPLHAAGSKLRTLQGRGNSPRRATLCYEFPEDGTIASPMTVVSVNMDEGLSWETAHSYPNENIVVFTRTELSV